MKNDSMNGNAFIQYDSMRKEANEIMAFAYDDYCEANPQTPLMMNDFYEVYEKAYQDGEADYLPASEVDVIISRLLAERETEVSE